MEALEKTSPVEPHDRKVVVEVDRRTWAIIAVLGFAAFMSVLDGTIVTVAVETFGEVFHSSLTTTAWVAVGYLLAAASALPISGWAIDRFGGRRIFVIGVSVFLVGSILASSAWSIGSLIAFRVVQGFGGGMMEPTAITLAASVAGPKRIGRIMGVLSLIVNVAPVLGPLVGGFFATTAHWRLIFLINVPVGALVLIAAWLVIPSDVAKGEPQAVDLRGLFLLTPGFVALLFAIDRVGAKGSVVVIAITAIGGIALLAAYGRRALRVEVPVVDLRLLTRPGFAASAGTVAVFGLIMYSSLIMLPLFLGQRFGATGAGRGLLTTALGVGLLISMSYASRRSDVTGPRPFVVPAGAVSAVGLGVFALFDQHLPIGALLVLFVVMGLSFGCIAAPTFSNVFRTVGEGEVAQATTSMFIIVQASASLGLTLIGLLLGNGSVSRFGPLFGMLAVVAVGVSFIGRLLPGAPDPDVPAPQVAVAH
ncbi:MAG: major facilitator superfamily 1 [Ilumatobacteraceae bacterium]|nr:major facilitator superfamily 1 [Ilumatobacteraceae bacterium]